MMKIFTAFTLFIVAASFSYAATVSDKKENNGNSTRIVTFYPGDKEYDSLKRMEMRYDANDILVSRMLYLSDAFSKEKDMVSQEEIYNKNGIIEKFIVTFTDDYYAISGIKVQIETVDSNDNITEVEYQTNTGFLFKEKYENRNSRFPFYKISFLADIMFEDFVDDPKITNYGISMKYVTATSIVTFIDQPIDLDSKDIDFLTMYSKSRKSESMIPLYSKKVLVKEDDKKYYVMIQDSLLKYIKINERAAINYYFGTRDNDLMMICTEFTDIH